MGNNLPEIDLGTGEHAINIVAGNRHFCALLQNRNVKCWGAFTYSSYSDQNPAFVGDQQGEMGDNLAYVSLPAGRSAKSISPSCAVLDNDSLYCWNTANNSWIPSGIIATAGSVTSVTEGMSFVCALLTNGQIKCLGMNSSGTLGQGDLIHRNDTTAVQNFAVMPSINLGTGRSATKISAGAFHVCALLDNGKIKCWGDNSYGVLGIGDRDHRGDDPGEMGDNLPSIDLGIGRTAIDISAGVSQTCARLDDHTMKCWGSNPDGRLGQGDVLTRGDSPNIMGDFLKAISLW